MQILHPVVSHALSIARIAGWGPVELVGRSLVVVKLIANATPGHDHFPSISNVRVDRIAPVLTSLACSKPLPVLSIAES